MSKELDNKPTILDNPFDNNECKPSLREIFNTQGGPLDPLEESIPPLIDDTNPLTGRFPTPSIERTIRNTFESNPINNLASSIKFLSNKIDNLELQNLKLSESLENIKYELKNLRVLLSKFGTGGKYE